MGRSIRSIIEGELEQGAGTLRLAPTWVPRSFCVPGRRIKLHPDDYYALGPERGGIDERWLSSTVRADNGPLTGAQEGLSEVVAADGDRTTLEAAVAELGPTLVGERIWDAHGGWPMYSKFFDNDGPLPYHVHHREHHASLVGRRPKAEAYYFPPQMNNHGGTLPVSYLGLRPDVEPGQLRQAIADFGRTDNRITDLAVGYRLRPGTGWDIPAGVLHAPGSFCTYEPQEASDVFCMCECVNNGRAVPEELLWKDVPPEHHGDVDFIVDLVDWEANARPDFGAARFMEPILRDAGRHDGVVERWIVYRSRAFSAKELTIPPGRSVTIVDAGAHGTIAVAGHGTCNGRPLATPTLIRFGQLTDDELFVTEAAALAGIRYENHSTTENLVVLQHFGPDNPDTPDPDTPVPEVP